MRIVLVNGFFPPHTTGSAHFTEDEARQLARMGHDVLVLTAQYKDAPADEMVDGYRVVRLPQVTVAPGRIAFNYSFPVVSRPRNVRRIWMLLDEFRPDVIHQNSQFFDVTVWTTLYSRHRRIPRAITIHTAIVHDRRLQMAVLRFADRWFVRPITSLGSPYWVSVDKRIDEYVREVYRPPAHRHTFIPVCLEADRFGEGDGARIRQQWGLGDAPVILSFGHVIPLRNRIALVRALPRIRERLPEVKVLLVGEVYTRECLDLAEQLGVMDAIVVVGRVPHDEVRHYIAAADIEGHDLQGIGLGITTLEVMAAGVPVFAVVPPDNYPGVDLSQWPELMFVDRDDPAFIADVVVRLLADHDLRERVVKDQRRFVDDLFSMEAVGRRYAEVFAQLTARG